MNTSCRIRFCTLLALALATAAAARSQTLDSSFPNANGAVYALAVQPDGKVLIGGGFTLVGTAVRNRLARLNANGTLDTNFNTAANSTVYSLAVQDDGAILVGGAFTTLGNCSFQRFARLNPDGTVDASFTPGVSNTVFAIAIQSDGKILAGGAFTNIGGQTRNYIGRVTKSGAVDPGFNPGADNRVNCLAVQTNGGIIVGGMFTHVGNQSCDYLGRLDASGNVDTGFYADADSYVYALAIQADGSILAAGRFTNLTWQASPYLGRMNPDGSLDSSFSPGAGGFVYSLALQTDGKILAGGSFTNLGGQSCRGFGRLNTNGTLDPNFTASASNTVYAVAIQGDGQILVGGSFSNLSGQARTNLGRYSNIGAAAQSLSLNGPTLTWMRSGVSPEVWRTEFEVSTNGNGWQSLGAGTRTAGGWQITGLLLPPDSSLRARGFTMGGQYNGSGGVIELVTGKPVIASFPTNLTSLPGSNVLFSVGADGPGLIIYQWRKDGTNLNDAGNILGAHTSNLTVGNVFGADAGDYSVVVSNGSGAVTSSIVRLTVLDPFIVTSPANQWITAGQSGIFNVTVAGTPGFTYQWRKEDTNLDGAIAASLTLPNAQRADIGNYTVTVSNRFGMATSSVAVLSVNLATCDTMRQDADGSIRALALQPDGQILVGGDFSYLGGSNRSCFARLHADGTLDPGFNTSVSGLQDLTYVNAFAVQPDEKILVGGSYIWFGSKYSYGLGRVDSNGIEDAGFSPMLYILGGYQFVSCLAIQTDGQILVAGCFDQFAGEGHTNVGRLNLAGIVDSSFNARSEEAVWPTTGRIYAMALQPDGKILVGGVFTNLCGQTRSRLGRLNADGTLDSSFNPGADGTVDCLAVQPDGKILVGGSFTQLVGQPRSNIGRLDATGIPDPNFNPGADAYVDTLVLQTDGKILLGGAFTVLAGQPCQRIGRLNPDGSADTVFNPLADGTVYSLAQQSDGGILVGGTFQNISGQARKGLARLTNPDRAVQSLIRSNSTISWMRAGSSPEISRASFDASTDGVTWSKLGDATRIAGGWQLTNISAPANALVRARGLALGGYDNGSSWLVETKSQKPECIIVMNDGAFGFRTNRFGFNVSGAAGMSAIIESSADLKNWVPLGTNQSGVDPFYFSDPTPSDSRGRFYRARLQ